MGPFAEADKIVPSDAASAEDKKGVQPDTGYPAQGPTPEPAQPSQAPVVPKAPVQAPKKVEKVVLENKWGTDDPVSGQGQDNAEQVSDVALPSLADAKASAAPVKKTPPPQP